MSRTILVPLDGSDFSHGALPRAMAIAGPEGGRVHLVTVVPPDPVGVREGGLVSSAADRQEAVERGEEYLRGVARRVEAASPGLAVTRRALPPGNIVGSLRGEVEEVAADLIVMTTHGRGGLQRAWLGSVADGLVRRAPRPVLLIRPDGDAPDGGGAEELKAAPPFRKALVPLDGSPASKEILGPVRTLATDGGLSVILFRVVPAHTAGAYPYMTVPPPEDETPTALLEAAEEELSQVVASLGDEGVKATVETRVLNQPARAILERADKGDVDLLAMSTRGLGGVSRLLLGSVADKVIRAAPLPTLVSRRASEG